jgi:hypothetical protein
VGDSWADRDLAKALNVVARHLVMSWRWGKGPAGTASDLLYSAEGLQDYDTAVNAPRIDNVLDDTGHLRQEAREEGDHISDQQAHCAEARRSYSWGSCRSNSLRV